jgi:hypothetical protein
MSYITYKLIHFLGLFTALVVMAARAGWLMKGDTTTASTRRRATGVAHGIAVFLILLGGFGMLARLGIAQQGLPGWIYLKLAIWVTFAGLIALVGRGTTAARVALVALPLLALAGGAVALYKPFQGG